MPCHNEAEAIPDLKLGMERLRSALQRRFDLQWLLVDDGSTDDTPSLMRELSRECDDVTVLCHDRCQGIAAAINTGLQHTTAEIVASLDADCTYDPLILEPMLQLLTREVDMVVASPYHPRGGVEGVPAWRLQLSQGASRIYGLLMRNKLHTYTSCVRVGWRVDGRPPDRKSRLRGHCGANLASRSPRRTYRRTAGGPANPQRRPIENAHRTSHACASAADGSRRLAASVSRTRDELKRNELC